jgi:NADPH:quinone reductase-like Zn-dependent oxidoreductase
MSVIAGARPVRVVGLVDDRCGSALIEVKNRRHRSVRARWRDHVSEGEIHPPIAAHLPLSEAARAHEMLGAGEVVGKLVLITGAADRA